MTIPICTRLSCLDTGPIVSAIKSIARGQRLESEEESDLETAADELVEVARLCRDPVQRALLGKLTQTEALALLSDEPCPPTERGAS